MLKIMLIVSFFLSLVFVKLDDIGKCVFGVIVCFMGFEFLFDGLYLLLKFEL